jgi:hypothetical protein
VEKFVDLYNSKKKNYEYKIKIALNDLQADSASKLEAYLEKYCVVSFKPFKKTPIQRTPLDFPNVKDTEVYITDVALEYPITPIAFQRELCAHLGISEQNVAVFTLADPRIKDEEDYNQRITDKDTFKKEYVSVIGNPEKWEEEPAYGKDYNDNFLKNLKSVNDITNTVINNLSPAQKLDAGTASKVEYEAQDKDAVLNDKGRNALDYVPRKYTMMTANDKVETPAKGGK